MSQFNKRNGVIYFAMQVYVEGRERESFASRGCERERERDGRTDGRTDGQTDGETDRRTDRLTERDCKLRQSSKAFQL